jgi:hypothetical protein
MRLTLHISEEKKHVHLANMLGHDAASWGLTGKGQDKDANIKTASIGKSAPNQQQYVHNGGEEPFMDGAGAG